MEEVNENKLIVEILGHINIGIVIIAGLLIVNTKKKIKLIGLSFYYLCNIVSFFMWIFSGLTCFLTSTLIFVIINTINLYQITKQKENKL